MYERLIDDGITAWHGSDEDFALFSAEFNQADPSIKFTWTALKLEADFLNVSLVSSSGTIRYEIYSKPGNAYSLPATMLVSCAQLLSCVDSSRTSERTDT